MSRVSMVVSRAVLVASLLLSGMISSAANAQDLKPVATISISSVGEVLADVKTVCQIGGAADMGDLVSGMGGLYTNGIDKTKPIGIYVMLAGMEPRVLAFVPVKDLKTTLNLYREQIGDPRDVGDGILQVAADKPRPLYLKEQNGFAFIAMSSAHLGALPADPVAGLGGLNKQYDVAIRLNLQNVPAELKQLAIGQLQQGMEQGLQNQNDPAAAELARNSLKSLTRLINEIDQFTLGYAVRSPENKTFVDATLTVAPGSEMATHMAKLLNLKSTFTGFLMPAGALRLNFVSLSMQEDIAQLTAMVKTVREKALKEIDNDPKLPDPATREKAKGAVNTILDVAEKTVAAGKMDGGAYVTLENNKLGMAAGGFVAEANRLEDALKQLADIGRNQPDFPKDLQFNAATHAGVALHTFSVKVADPGARQVLGDVAQVAVGTSPNSAYVAFGDQPSELIKKVIDQSANGANAANGQTTLVVSLAKVMRFAANLQNDPKVRLLADTLEASGGKDHVIVVSHAIPNGVTSRVEIQDGVLKLIGASAKAAQAGGGGF